jgi:hypothetical protein
LDENPEPVPVSPPGTSEPQPVPVPVPPPAPKPKEEEDEPIALVSDDEMESVSSSSMTAKKRIAGAAARGLTHKKEFRRKMNVTGEGATRCRLFYSKIADGPMLAMETIINEWLDEEEIEVKHVGHVIGTLQGKTAEPNMIVMVWY